MTDWKGKCEALWKIIQEANAEAERLEAGAMYEEAHADSRFASGKLYGVSVGVNIVRRMIPKAKEVIGNALD